MLSKALLTYKVALRNINIYKMAGVILFGMLILTV
jgi:hypothetical protein